MQSVKNRLLVATLCLFVEKNNANDCEALTKKIQTCSGNLALCFKYSSMTLFLRCKVMHNF